MNPENFIVSRSVARESAFQALYIVEVGKADEQEAIEVVCTRQTFADSARIFLSELILGVSQKKDELDQLISPHLAEGWTLDRLATSDLIALRLATYELHFCDTIPPKVSISQAVSLAKRFGSESSGSFTNGVLRSILEASPKKEWTPPAESSQDQDEEIPEEAPQAKENHEEDDLTPQEEPIETVEAGSWVLKLPKA